MKKITLFSLILVFLAGSLFAQDNPAVKNQNQKGKTHKVGFVDANGDGYNDNAADHDGDGVPNGMDDDYTGAKNRKGGRTMGFVDANGDGINDNAMDHDGDGIPNGQDEDFVRPQDGSGNNMRINQNQNGNGVANGANDNSNNSNSKGNRRKGNK